MNFAKNRFSIVKKITKNGLLKSVFSTFQPFTFLFSLFTAATAAVASANVSLTPYTFCGRVVDAAHEAFDASRAATISAYDSSSNLLATAKTFYRSDSRLNYALDIPMTSSPVDGCAVQNDVLTFVVTAEKKEWSGVIPLSESVVGAPGGVKELDVVLGRPDQDTRGIDSDLYWQLFMDWCDSKYYVDGAEFDPDADYDGDGISTIKEAYAGTDPFDPDSKVAIISFAHDETKGEDMVISVSPSRAYAIEGATSLEQKDWIEQAFSVEGSQEEQKVFSCPSSRREGSLRVFLSPVTDGARFFRIRVE